MTVAAIEPLEGVVLPAGAQVASSGAASSSAVSSRAAAAPAARAAPGGGGPVQGRTWFGGGGGGGGGGGQGGGGRRQAQQAGPAPGPAADTGAYHRWVIAEFAIAVVVIGASPLLRPGGPIGKGNAGKVEEGSLAGPLIRLTAVCILFFVLALMANGPRSGKIAAAFGALVDLGIIFNSLPEWKTITTAFGGKNAKEDDTNPVGED